MAKKKKEKKRKEKLWQQNLPTRQKIRQESYRIKNLFFSPNRTEHVVSRVYIKYRATWLSNGTALLFHKVCSWVRHLRVQMLALNFCLKNILTSQIFPLCGASHTPYSTTLIVSLLFLPKKGFGYLYNYLPSRYCYSYTYMFLFYFFWGGRMLSFKSSFYILDTNPLSAKSFTNTSLIL